jgi:hypothetical protein
MPNDKDQTIEELKNEVAQLQVKIQTLGQPPAQKPKKAVRTLFRWQAFSRPYTRRGTRWFIYTFLLVATIILVLLFVREFFIIAPVLALGFVAYVLATVPPEIGENTITTQGINTAGHTFIWEELDDFWFTEKRGFHILNFDTFLPTQRRINVLINQENREKIRELLARYRPFRELPKTTLMDRAADGLSNMFHKLTS